MCWCNAIRRPQRRQEYRTTIPEDPSGSAKATGADNASFRGRKVALKVPILKAK